MDMSTLHDIKFSKASLSGKGITHLRQTLKRRSAKHQLSMGSAKGGDSQFHWFFVYIASVGKNDASLSEIIVGQADTF